MKKGNLKTFIIIVIINIVILIIGLLIGFLHKDDKVETEYETIQLLKDANYFFSVESHLNTISNYVLEKDLTTLYGILNKEYISNNNITIDNVLSNFNNYLQTSFDVKEIYVISKGNLYKFFIKANIRKNSYDGNSEVLETKYAILNYDNKNITFDIEFISDNEYKDFITNKLEFSFNEIKNNNYNKFNYKNISEATLATYYLNNFINLIYEDSKIAYATISTDTREKYFNNYNNFVSFVNNHNEMFNNIIVSSYYFSNNNCYCVDNYGNEYEFIITSVNKYIVSIYFKNI